MKYFYLFIFISTIFFTNIAIKANGVDSLLLLLNKENNDSLKIDVLNKLAVEVRLSYPDSSKAYANKALAVARKAKFKRGEGISLTNLAGIEANQGDYEKAISHFLQAATIFDSLKSNKGLSNVYANVAGIYAFKKEYKKALSYLENALNIYTQLNNLQGIIYCNNQIGNIFAYQNHHNSALPYYEAALIMSKKNKEDYSTACAMGNVASCYSAVGEHSKALDKYLEALELLEKTNFDKTNLATMYANVGQEYMQLKQYSQSIIYVNKGLALAKSLKYKRTVKFCYELLARIYEEKKEFEMALKYQKLYTQLKDSLLNEENNKSITEMQTKYETEKKEKEIQLLNKDSRLKEIELARQKAEISKTTVQRNGLIAGAFAFLVLGVLFLFYIRAKRNSEKLSLEKQLVELEQKALSLQMNPHFIFNSINSISSFISQNDALSAKKYLAKFAKLMRLILENSRETVISIRQETETLGYYLELEQLRFNNKFSFKINVAEDIDPEIIAIPPMLVQPQVENAILHGVVPKDGDGIITINFYISAEKIICEVLDNGVGRKRSFELNRERAKDHKSLGIQVTVERLNVINTKTKEQASLRVEDVEDEFKNSVGTKVTFELPIQTVDT